MQLDLENILLKKISTFFSLIFIVFLAFVVGAYTINQAQKIKKLQEPMPIYVESNSSVSPY